MNKKIFFGALIAASGIMGMTSCSNEDVNATLEKEYEQNFDKIFSSIASEQNFNMAQSVEISATVDGNGEYTLNVYSESPSNPESRMLGKFENLQAGKTVTLNCDAPKSVSTLYYTINREGEDMGTLMSAPVENKKSVLKANAIEESGTSTEVADDIHFNTYNASGSTNNCTFTETSEGAFTKFDKGFFDYITSKNSGTDILAEGTNHSQYVKDFAFKCENPSGEIIKFYPILNICANNNKVGCAIYKDGVKDREFELLDNQNIGDYLYWYGHYVTNYLSGTGKEATTSTSTTKNQWQFGDYAAWTKKLTSDSHYVLSKPVEVKLNYGETLVLYIQGPSTKDADGKANAKFYSVASYNPGKMSAVVYQRIGDKNSMLIGFEDTRDASNTSAGDKDFNDIVFYTENVIRTNPEVEAQQWTIAYEDLGDTDDFDFNDVVLHVTHMSGSTDATVQMVAAGGTLETYISYDGKDLYGEVHKAYGVDQDCMVNTNAATKANMKGQDGLSVDPVKITVPTDFSIELNGDAFAITVVGNDGKTTEIKPYNNGQTGRAPQAIVLSTSSWVWPCERMRVDYAYPQINEWIKNDYKNATWMSSPATPTNNYLYE